MLIALAVIGYILCGFFTAAAIVVHDASLEHLQNKKSIMEHGNLLNVLPGAIIWPVFWVVIFTICTWQILWDLGSVIPLWGIDRCYKILRWVRLELQSPKENV